jgi:hypothetical protein
MPKKAETHIQKIAPGPPMPMAVATPAILPVPMVAARAVESAWNCEIARPSPALVTEGFLKMARKVSLLICPARVI